MLDFTLISLLRVDVS